MLDAAQQTLNEAPVTTGYTDPELGEHAYDFYRCQRCQRVITQPQLRHAVRSGVARLRVCPCGGLKFSPTNPRWYEFLLPRVLRFAWQRARAIGLAGLRANLRGLVS